MIRRLFSPLPILALLFLGPLVLAIVLYAGRDSFGGFESLPNPDRELIANPPIVPMTVPGSTDPTVSLRSRWLLIYARMPACDTACVSAIERLGQVYLALGKERERVRLVFLVAGTRNDTPQRADFLFGTLDAPEGAEWVRVLGTERLEQGRYFVVDPLGNLILSYPAAADQKRLLEDLERLLNVSRIG